MKNKIFTLFIAASVFTISNAQTISNGGFENWTNDSIDGWDCSNADMSFFEMTNISTIDADAPEGTKALMAESKATAFFTMSGIVCNGIYEAPNPSNGNIETIKGVPFTDQPDNLYLWYKCEPMTDDSAFIKISFFKDGDEIASGSKVETNTVSDWTLLNIPVTWTQQTAPDTMLILLKSSYGTTDSNGGAVAGSKLYADGLSFTEPTAINHEIKSDIRVFPVPFNDMLHVRLEKPVNTTYRIISVT
ncbi:MAG: hypothetical protein ACOC10_08700, partial [Bacteroidota bacterium]